MEAAVHRVLASGQYVLGEDVGALERELAAYSGRAHAVGVSSGSDALLSSLMALGVKAGDEVITTAFSFFATVGAIVRLGARPVFAEIEPGSLNLDPDDALRRVTPRTRAIIPVDLFGRRADVARLANAGVPIVEDAAQAVGAPDLGVGAKLATLSFFPAKNLGATGDGGMVLTDDAELADRLRLLRQHGSRPKYVHAVVGGNFRLDTLQAAIVRAKLPHLATWNLQRKKNAARYRTLLSGTPLGLPEDTMGHVWHHFVVRAPRRDELKRHLAASEIDSEVYYPLALHLQPCFAALEYKPGDLPCAERATQEVLALPVHPDLSDEQLTFVAERVREFYGEAR